MADTQAVADRISRETGTRYRLTDAAVDQAKRRLRINDIDDLAAALGFSRQTFWRIRRGETDIRLSDARTLAARIGWPLERTFEAVTRG